MMLGLMAKVRLSMSFFFLLAFNTFRPKASHPQVTFLNSLSLQSCWGKKGPIQEEKIGGVWSSHTNPDPGSRHASDKYVPLHAHGTTSAISKPAYAAVFVDTAAAALSLTFNFITVARVDESMDYSS